LKQGSAHLSLTLDWIRQSKTQGDPDKAIPMSAYMRNRFDFLGWPQAIRRQHQQGLWVGLQEAGAASKGETLDNAIPASLIDVLWQQPEREFQYTAMELALRYRACWGDDWIRSVYGWIQTKSWWDTVDWLAPKALGWYILNKTSGANKKSGAGRGTALNTPLLEKVIAELHAHPNLWMQRSAFILQLDFREQTRFNLLSKMCLEKADTREFFLAKAMGWALRQYARQEPELVRAFVQKNPQLPALTRREALKHLA
jgi:3-methyladenine DNA glycosylase AlkD